MVAHLGHAIAHTVDLQRLADLGVIWPRDGQRAAILLDAHRRREGMRQLALGAGDGYCIVSDHLDLYAGGDGNRRASDTRHLSSSLPDVADHFAAQPLLV